MNDYNFGNLICMLRERKGLTQYEVASMLNVTPAAVSKWENGISKPRVKVLFQLADILGVKAEELMAGRFLNEETIDAEAIKRINERYEYLTKIDSYTSTSVKVKRLLAVVIDFLMAVLVSWLSIATIYKLFPMDSNSPLEAAVFVLGLSISFFLFLGFRDLSGFGRSLGKRILGLYILDKKNGKKPKIKQILLRNCVTAAFIVSFPSVLVVDVIIMLVRGQSICDSLANTVVVKKEPNDKVTCKKEADSETIKEKITVEQKAVSHSDINLQKINSYKSPPSLSKKFIVSLISIIASILIISFGLILFYFIEYDAYDVVSTDITNYEEDCATYGNASDFMPELDSLGDYTDISYSHKKTFYSAFMGFISEGLALFVEYDETIYEIKKEEILNSYTFLDEPVLNSDYDAYLLPVTSFSYKNYQMKIIPDENYNTACKSFAMVGFDDENKSIVYCYHYSFDMDYIAEVAEDPEAEMCEFMDTVFAWKNTD